MTRGPDPSRASPTVAESIAATIASLPRTTPLAMVATCRSLLIDIAGLCLAARHSDFMQATLAAIHRIASLVRDRISIDTWRIINRFAQDFPPARHGVRVNEVLPADKLLPRAWELAALLTRQSHLVTRYTRVAFTHSIRQLLVANHGYGIMLEGMACVDDAERGGGYELPQRV